MFTLKELEKYTNGRIINGNENKRITHYCVNYKFNMKDGFYIPIDFHGVNREIYIIDSVKHGGIGFMIDKNSIDYEMIIKETKKVNPNICILEVDSVNDSIYSLAKINRKLNIEKPIIGITGSVGKTTMSCMLSNILKKEKRVLHDFDNRNMNTKVLISSDLMHLENYDIAVVEMGTSKPGNMTILSELVQPSIGVITTIGTAHLNNFHTKENILNDKIHITDYFKEEKILFVNSDNDLLDTLQESEDYKIVKCSINEASNVVENKEGISFNIDIYNKKTKFNLQLFSLHYLSSIVIAIRIAEHYKIKYQNIIDGIKEFKPIDGRQKILRNIDNDLILIDDSYSSSFESAKLGLDTANKLNSNRKIAVLGKMAAYGEEADYLHEELGRYFNNLSFDYLYLTGEYSKRIFKGALNCFEEKKIKKFKTQELLLEDLESNIQKGDLIYIKAAHTQNFSNIVKELKSKYNLIN
ncbi:MAG: UDP-N-acetylmuramoyl-tripeptide--D-alanyl-D-alanine ligase [Clostridia bacterium]|nr:UDP-N-acetylmuramoyl-tripeptide--D-alanyl-D-alanine ligase [Clostridia bacterium]